MDSPVAVIDLGTNTFHLLIASIQEENIRRVAKKQIPVKLGEGGINKGMIMEIPFERGIQALTVFKKIIDDHPVEKVIAYATSAIRGASNGRDFMARAHKVTGIAIEIISGEKEADLIYEGVRHSVDFGREKVLVMDIGGGSVEFIIADGHEVYWKGSFLLGAARLIDKFHKNDPISHHEQTALRHHLETELISLFSAAKKYNVKILVGSAGSFESIVELIQEHMHKIIFDESESTYPVNIDDFEHIHHMLLKSTTEERKQMKGLVDYRVEMIVVSSIMIDFVLKKLGIKQLMVTLYALKEGMLYEEAHRSPQKSVSS